MRILPVGSKADVYNTLRHILAPWLVSIEEDANLRRLLELVMLKTEVSPELAAGMQEKLQGNRATLRLFADLIRHAITAGEVCPDIHPESTAAAAPAW